MSSPAEVLEQMIAGLKGEQAVLNHQIKVLEKARRNIDNLKEPNADDEDINFRMAEIELVSKYVLEKPLKIPLMIYTTNDAWVLKNVFIQQGCKLPNGEYYFHFYASGTHMISAKPSFESNAPAQPEREPLFFGDHLVYCGGLYKRKS